MCIAVIQDLLTQTFEKIHIVDENNLIIGKTSRIFSFLFKKPHRSVNIFIFKDSSYKEVLLQKRQPWIRFPLKLADCAGAVPFNLTYEQSAYKELHEELFHKQPLPKIKLRKIAEFKDTSIKPFTFSQILIGVYPGPFFPNPLEVKEIAFLRIDKLKNDLNSAKTAKKYSPSFRQAYLMLIKHLS